jgi:hypothetical protein
LTLSLLRKTYGDRADIVDNLVADEKPSDVRLELLVRGLAIRRGDLTVSLEVIHDKLAVAMLVSPPSTWQYSLILQCTELSRRPFWVSLNRCTGECVEVDKDVDSGVIEVLHTLIMVDTDSM